MERLNVKPIDYYVTKRQLNWAGHVARMNYERLPRKLMSSWVKSKRLIGCPEFTYGRGLLKVLNKATIPKETWHEFAQNRDRLFVEWNCDIIFFFLTLSFKRSFICESAMIS